MRISELKLHGFKSFAGKTVFTFNDGEITGVVGPNGSGKSNIVDALRWVLGEQRTGVLRSDKMDNVIFNGGSKRKPLGMAEVSLTIDNDESVLPADYSEVVITRRLYRSGESQYLLNNTPCRLKDINELFMDTGIGPDAYSVIELKMVESILSQNKVERRALFEEASGVTKYKKRRDSAMRKLDSTRDDLTRVNDIISEVEKNVRVLSRQVSKARRHRELTEEFRRLDIQKSQFQRYNILQKLSPLQEEFSQLQNTGNITSSQMSLDEKLAEEYTQEITTLENELKDSQNVLNQLNLRISEKEKNQVIEDERKRANTERIEANQNELITLAEKQADLSVDKTTLQQQVGQLNANVEDLQYNYENSYRDLEATEREIARLESELNQQQGHLAVLRKTIEESVMQEKNLAARQNALHQNRQQAELREQQLLQEITGHKQTTAALLKSDTEADNAYSDIENTRVDLHNKESRTRESIAAKKDELLELKSNAINLRKEIDFYTGLINRFTGFSEAVRKTMAEAETIPGLLGPLADLVELPAQWQRAFESVFASWLNVLVVQSKADAIAIRNKIGSEENLFVFSLDSNDTLQKVSHSQDDVNDLSGLVKCDEALVPLLKVLTRNVVFVENAAQAEARWQQNSANTYVTADGEIFYASGIVKTGQTTSSPVTGRKQMIDKLRAAEAANATHLSAQLEELRLLEEGLEQIQTSIRENRQALEKAKDNKQQLRLQLLSEQTKTEEKEKQVQALHQSYAAMDKEIREIAIQMQSLNPDLEKYHYSEKQFQEAIAAYSTDLEQRKATFKTQTDASNNARLMLVEEKARLAQITAQVKQIDQRNAEFIAARHRMETDIEKFQKENQRFDRDKLDRDQLLIGEWRQRDELSRDISTKETRIESLKENARKMEHQLKQYRQAHETYLEKREKLALKIQDYELRAVNIAENIRQKYHVELSDRAPDVEIDPVILEKDKEAIEAKLNSIGEVNPLALEEHEEENKRLQFLLQQRGDILDAESQLLDTIKTINHTARKQFEEIFNQIRENFSTVFGQFFEDGDGTIELEDSGDPLESNILISVRPKGRKPQTIHLMSSGEKTLTAISLLFAIYLVKPSPFCILDEVDAPLDDVNIGRFTRAIKKFSDNTQFILVTHNKSTMGVLDAIYGITQEEAGVSKVVSVDFRQKNLN
jgi:chromosome segregation protein